MLRSTRIWELNSLAEMTWNQWATSLCTLTDPHCHGKDSRPPPNDKNTWVQVIFSDFWPFLFRNAFRRRKCQPQSTPYARVSRPSSQCTWTTVADSASRRPQTTCTFVSCSAFCSELWITFTITFSTGPCWSRSRKRTQSRLRGTRNETQRELKTSKVILCVTAHLYSLGKRFYSDSRKWFQIAQIWFLQCYSRENRNQFYSWFWSLTAVNYHYKIVQK